MKVCIFGSRGQLGSELRRILGDSALPLDRTQVDITDLNSISAQLDKSPVDIVINAAAYNLVDQAEDEPDVAYKTNALGPRNLAIACAERDLAIVHVSSDYVFGLNANGRPWSESERAEPVSSYGTSKLAGEFFVRSLAPKHFVLRTCGLYGHAARAGAGKGNFVETMLRLGQERDELKIVDDQYCTPTSVEDLAQAISEIMTTSEYGLYHATNLGECTWARFAEEIFRLSRSNTKVTRIPSSEYPTKARRPSYSILNCEKLNSVLSHPMPSWESAVEQYLSQRNSSSN